MSNKKIFIFAAFLFSVMTLQALGQANPGQADLLYQQARALAYDRKYAEAIDSLKEAYSFDSQNRRVMILLGDIYIKIGNLPGAEQAFNQLREIDPKVPEGYLKLAEAYWYWEKYSTAMEYLKTAAQLSNPPDAGVFHWMGQIYRSNNQPEKSDSILKEGLKIYPDNPMLLANYGATRIVLGDTTGAYENMNKAYKIDSSSVYVVNAMATYYMAMNDILKASYYLQRATEIDPDDPFTRSNAVAFSMAAGADSAKKHFIEGNEAFDKALYRKARDLYLTSLSEDSTFFEVWVNLAYAYIHLGDVQEAAESFQKAIEINPDYPPAYIGWGDALIGLGRLEEAIEKYKKATELAPNDSQIVRIYHDVLDLKDSLKAQGE